MRADVELPRYAPRPVCWLAWCSPELAASAALGAVSITVATPLAPTAALPVLALVTRETYRYVRNRRVLAAHRHRLAEQHQQIEQPPAEDTPPAAIQATAVRLDQPPRELESGR